MPIVWKELYAIVCAVNSWGHLWSKQKILFHCDNKAVVDIWRKGSTRDPETMALVRMLYLRAAQHQVNVVVTHITGINNCIADALSRFQANRFQELAPQESRPHPCMADPILRSTLQQLIYLEVASSTCFTYRHPFRTYNIPPYPASPLTLQFFCAYSASLVSYKTI